MASFFETTAKSRNRTMKASFGERLIQDLHDLRYDHAGMTADRIVPVLSLSLLALAALALALQGKNNQTFDGVVVLNFMTYEFYPNAKDCNYQGTPYVVLPNDRFRDLFASYATDPDHLDPLFHGTWRAKLNGNLSRAGWYKYSETYWRELSVNYVVSATSISCSAAR
jgi:hypothetical protein